MKALIINCSPVRTGATAEIVKLVSEQLSSKYRVKRICIDDYAFAFCRGCRSCHNTAKCVMDDAVALRTGPNMPECEKIIGSIEHFYGHLEIECKGHLGVTSIEYKTDVEPRKQEIIDFCKNI
ncbi:flavodoxin family protein [Butyrivibrio sp. INlla21]|uniref:flavodoxin family protein n=1 Tax=Butyrivibrio sp. INlla21 TaxID=1520811 RepID=UPI0008E8800B|nr:flavodoxin family protein [Butyrivibrio sp. INlla21]SFV02006.1 hypothetical protein SAMN02910342_03002 [Butyrivibrio sp. INlla21]